jgi:hypothetical protein
MKNIWYSNQIIQDSKVVQVYFFFKEVKDDLLYWYSTLHLTVNLYISLSTRCSILSSNKKLAKDIVA